MSAPRKYDKETRDRAVRMYQDRLAEGGILQLKARQEVGGLLDINHSTLRNWIQARLLRAEQPEPVQVNLVRRRGFKVDVVLDGLAEIWMFHDTLMTRKHFDSWAQGESAELRPHGLLMLAGGTSLYPCRHPLQWQDCIQSSEHSHSRD